MRLRRFAWFALPCALAACADGTEIAGNGGAGGTAATGSTTSAGGAGTTASSTASTGEFTTSSASGGGAGGDLGGGGAGGGTGRVSVCGAGRFAIGVLANGDLQCSTIDAAARGAINANCELYAGWIDGCEPCGLPPTKWGRVGATSCANGAGANNTCNTLTLGADTLEVFSLNTDGDVDETDEFHASLQCDPVAPTTSAGPCGLGELAVDVDGDEVTCAPAASAVIDFVRTNCSVYMGWRDGCDGCTTAPSKWGFTNDTACDPGVGVGNSCVSATLGGQAVRLIGVDTDGDVDGNDVFYMGLRCDDAVAATTDAAATCPAGQFVNAVNADGTVGCASIAPLVEAYFEQQCNLWFGWRDSCSGCGLVPSKWGKVSANACATGGFTHNVCITPTLGGETVRLLGVNWDGDANDDDQVYYAFRCE